MKILRQPESYKELEGPVFLGAGFFDGVHLGHQMVLGESVRRAREEGGEAWVLTFDLHPLSVLAPSKAPLLLTTLEDRLSLFEKLGLDGVLLLPFTRQLAVQEPEHFVRMLCGESSEGRSPLSEIRCGDNWRFGKRAAGTPQLLAHLGERYGFTVEIVSYAYYQDREISSTRIREAVRTGQMEEAETMLGHPFFIRDKVVRGRGEGGRILHCATANITPRPEGILPPCGVYAVTVETSGRLYPGVADLGFHPTFGGDTSETPTLETHLLDFHGDLYGECISVSFLRRLREERTFASPPELADQIGKDVELALEIFKGRKISR